MLATPAAAMSAVALGLRLGAGSRVIAAEVWGAPQADAGTGLAWQIVVFGEDHGVRAPVANVDLDVLARAGDVSAQWHGETNEDGVAEARLGLERTPNTLSVVAGRSILARGACEAPPDYAQSPAAPAEQWLRFARREGAIALDVAVLGHRVAPGVPAELWVRATDATSHFPAGGVEVEIENDSSLVAMAGGPSVTDSRGWARVTATPAGLAVTVTLDARSRDGREGQWIGGLFMSPGAASVETRPRWRPDEPPEFGVTMPTHRTVAYFEIDDARGRAWAAASELAARPDGTSSERIRGPLLAPGLYWAIVSDDPSGAPGLATGTIARPFFVASSDAEALEARTDLEACSTPLDPRELSSAVSSCLALAATTPAPRWRALDGFERVRVIERGARAKGLAVALGAIVVAMLLEAVLLLRAAAARDASNASTWAPESVVGRTAVAILVGLLGFALLAAFIFRAG
jgi:hypothetical protein